VNKNANGDGGMNVHTIKLNSPKKKPMNDPAIVPSSIAVIMTGKCARVATIGPIGIEPRGVNANIAWIASNIANCTRNIIFFLFDF
jgi:hypothetical protein